jgi:site-specific DNA-cytosine methylase
MAGGAGFSDYALHAASRLTGIPVDVVLACDSWGQAVRVYNANLPVYAACLDVRTLTALPPHELVIGGPPCQPFSLAGQRAGHDDPRNCLPDFLRLVGDSPFVMENVRPRLISAPWSQRYTASDFGDVTTRVRWFYSSHLLNVIATPGPRRIRDIREAGADERAVDRREAMARTKGARVHRDGDFMGSVTCSTWLHKAGAHGHYDDGEHLGSLTAKAWHGHDVRGYGNLLRLGMRGHSASASASAFQEDEFLGSFVSNSWHGNEHSKLDGCRNPTLLEMQRAHSIPDHWDWAGTTKTDKGKMIANGWPIGMGTAVLAAALRAL